MQFPASTFPFRETSPISHRKEKQNCHQDHRPKCQTGMDMFSGKQSFLGVLVSICSTLFHEHILICFLIFYMLYMFLPCPLKIYGWKMKFPFGARLFSDAIVVSGKVILPVNIPTGMSCWYFRCNWIISPLYK